LVFDEAFIDHRQPAQDLLESHRLAHIAPLAAGPSSIAPRAGPGAIIPTV